MKTQETGAEIAGIEVKTIPLVLLQPSAENARKSYNIDKLAELVASIKQDGVQVPLLVRPFGTPNGHPLAKQHYEIVCGHRRFSAASRAQLTEVPCIVRELTDAEARDLGIVDNLQREGLEPLDEATAFAELMCASGATVESVAAKVKAEKAYRAVLFKTIAAAPGQDLQKAFDRIVTDLSLYAIRRSNSTKYGALAEAAGIPKEALTGYDFKRLGVELAKRPAHARAMLGLLAIQSSSLTVHEYDLTGNGPRKNDRKLDLEELAEVVGVDWKALRAEHTPVADPKPKPKKAAKAKPEKAAKAKK